MTTVTSPDDLLAAVPFLIGYHPQNSLVVIALRGDTVGMAMRVDYPEDIDLDQIDTLASHLVEESATSALIVAYVPDAVFDSEYLLAPLREAITMRDISIRECIEIRGDRWKSTICDDEGCCPPEGSVLPDIEVSRIAAEQVAQGKPLPFKNVDGLTASLASTPEDSELLELLDHVEGIDYEGDEVASAQRAGAIAMTQFVAEFAEKGVVEDKEKIAFVLVRLMDVQVRDYAMGMTNDENIETMWSMWRWLTRIAPVGYVAPVASIFAVTSYEKGDGALAQKALDRAFADDGGYGLAKLLLRTFASGWPPSAFAQMRAELHPKICAKLFGDFEGETEE